jgi:hypothetical protein
MNQQYITPKKKNPNLVNGQSAMNNLSNGTTPTTGFTAYDDPNYKPSPQSGANAGPKYLPTFSNGGSSPTIMPGSAPTGGQNGGIPNDPWKEEREAKVQFRLARGDTDFDHNDPWKEEREAQTKMGIETGITTQVFFPPPAPGPQAGFPPPGLANGQPPSMPQPPQAPTGYSTARMDIPRFETWMGRQDAAREAARFFTDVWNADPQTKAKLSAEYGGVTKKGNLKFFKTQQEVLANPLFGGEAPWHNLAVQGAAAFGGDEEAFMEWANDMVAEEATRAMEQTGKMGLTSGEQGAPLLTQIGDVDTSNPKNVIEDTAIAKLNLEHPDWKPGETSQVQQDLALKFNQNSAIMKQGTTPEAKDAAFQQILDDYGKGLVSEGAFQQVLTSNPQIANDPRVATTMSIRNAALAGQQNGAVTNGAGQNGVVSNGTAAMGQLTNGTNGTNGTKDYVPWKDMSPADRQAMLANLGSYYKTAGITTSTIEPEASVVGKDQDYEQEWYESPGGIPTKVIEPFKDITIGGKLGLSASKGPTFGTVRRDAQGREILNRAEYDKRIAELEGDEAAIADFQSKHSFQDKEAIKEAAKMFYPISDKMSEEQKAHNLALRDQFEIFAGESPGSTPSQEIGRSGKILTEYGSGDLSFEQMADILANQPITDGTTTKKVAPIIMGDTEANTDTAAATVSGDPLFVPEKTGEFKGIIDYFNASDEERKTMTHPLTELTFDASTGDLSGASFDRLDAFMKLRAGETARKDFLANQRIDNLASIGMVEVDGVMQPTDVALRNRAQLTQDLSGIANDFLSPDQVENFLKGTVDEDMRKKLVAGYEAKRNKVAEELKVLKAQSLLQDANKQSILAEIGVRERDISLAEKQQEFTEGIAEREMSLAEKQQADALGISGRELTLAEKAQADALGISEREMTLAEMQQTFGQTIAQQEQTRKDKQFLLEEERFGEEVLAKQQELDRLDSELEWQKSHSAAELAERIKTREAQTEQYQAELTNIAEREEDQRTFQKTMTEMQQTFETGMAERDRSHETQMMQQQLSHDTSMQQLQQQTQFATQAMSMLSNNPSALYALQRLPGLESLAQLLGIGRIEGGAQVPGMPTSAIPTIGSLQEAGPQAAQQAQTMAGLTQGLTPQGFAQQVRSVTPGGGFAQGPISMGGITRTGRA